MEQETIIVIVSLGIGSLWAFAQLIEKAQNWPLNREKLRLEVEKLRIDNAFRNNELERSMEQTEEGIILKIILKRLKSSEIKIIDVEIVRTDDEG